MLAEGVTGLLWAAVPTPCLGPRGRAPPLRCGSLPGCPCHGDGRGGWQGNTGGLIFCLLLQLGPHLPKPAFIELLKDNEVLQQLALQACADWLTDKELLPVIGQNHHLQQVQLNGCAQLSRHALVAISLSCPHLRQLSLAHCEWVDSLSLRSLADHCKALEAVDLTACRQLKDEAVCYLAQKCSGLKCLSLAVNANMGDVAVEEIAKCCPELEHLDLTGCLRVKNDAIRY